MNRRNIEEETHLEKCTMEKVFEGIKNRREVTSLRNAKQGNKEGEEETSVY